MFDASKQAASWWGAKIRQPGLFDNGDPSPAAFAAMVAVDMIRRHEGEPTAAEVAAFEGALAARIDRALAAPGHREALPLWAGPVCGPMIDAISIDIPFPYPEGGPREEQNRWIDERIPLERAADAEQVAAGALFSLSLSVDYHPSEDLYIALEAAGLGRLHRIGGLPCKTGMRVQRNAVWVRDGYGAPWTAAWRAPA